MVSRQHTTIRNGDLTTDPTAPRDAEWTPVINTPLRPEYPAAHSIKDGVGVAILEAYFGMRAIARVPPVDKAGRLQSWRRRYIASGGRK